MPPLTPAQTAAVVAHLRRQEDYLRRLERRLKEIGVPEGHHVRLWIEKARWAVGGAACHFEHWGNGEDRQPIQSAASHLPKKRPPGEASA